MPPFGRNGSSWSEETESRSRSSSERPSITGSEGESPRTAPPRTTGSAAAPGRAAPGGARTHRAVPFIDGHAVAIADFNADGRPDVTLALSSGTVAALLNDGTGYFGIRNPSSDVQFGSNRSEEHTSELQSRPHLVCRLLLEKKKRTTRTVVALRV